MASSNSQTSICDETNKVEEGVVSSYIIEGRVKSPVHNGLHWFIQSTEIKYFSIENGGIGVIKELHS